MDEPTEETSWRLHHIIISYTQLVNKTIVRRGFTFTNISEDDIY